MVCQSNLAQCSAHFSTMTKTTSIYLGPMLVMVVIPQVSSMIHVTASWKILG